MKSYSLPSKAFKVTRIEDPLGDGWFASHKKTEDINSIEFVVSKANEDFSPEVSIDLRGEVKWFRLLREIEMPNPSKGRPQLRVSYAAESISVGPGVEIGICGIFGRDDTGYLGAIALLDDRIVSSETKISCQGVIELDELPEIYNKFFLVFEIRKAGQVKIFDLEMCVPESQEEFYRVQSGALTNEIKNVEDASKVVVPYRIANFSSSDLLAKLNDNIDRDLRKAPLDWIKGMLTVALRNEDYETALALVEHAVEIGETNGKPIDSLVDGICKTLAAYGDQARLESFAIRIARGGGQSSDAAREAFLNALGESTNDLFSVNRQIASDHTKVDFGAVLDLLDGKSDDYLLLANHYRPRNRQQQHEAINAYLSDFDLPYEVKLGDDDTNVLNGIEVRLTSSPAVEDAENAGFETTYKPLVSIICAAYNCESTIDYAVRSILDQDYQNIEILIADDCSDDGTLEKILHYQKIPNVRVFRSKENQGPYNIRNALIKEAKGELITFHDSDDFALPHRVEAQVSSMIGSGAVVSIGRWIRIMPNGHFMAFPDGKFLRMCVNSIMFQRKVFEVFGPYRSVLFGADSEFYEKVRGHLRPDQVCHVEIPGVLGLWSSSSLTRTAGMEADECGFRAPKRRLYAGLAGRQRILGDQIVPNDLMEDALREAGIYREAQPVEEMK